MISIISPNQQRVFTLAQAQELFPLIYRLTDEASKNVSALMSMMSQISNQTSEHSEKRLQLQDEVNQAISKWQGKLEKLGIKSKGLWMADFDNGHGYFCWKYPEQEILFKHGYQDGFSGRILITSKEEFHENRPSTNQPNPS